MTVQGQQTSTARPAKGLALTPAQQEHDAHQQCMHMNVPMIPALHVPIN